MIKRPKLLPFDYGIIHFDSPDKRGIDVALLYQKKNFRPTTFSTIPLLIYKNKSTIKKETKEELDGELEEKSETKLDHNRVFTRDQFLISGFLESDEVHIIINHWPSRSRGEKVSSPFREAAGR